MGGLVLRVATRDKYMAWVIDKRRGHVQRITCLSRYWVCPTVRCRLLASYALGRILQCLPRDVEQRYGYRPYLIERFADEGDEGIYLRAVHFVSIGCPSG